MRIALNGYGRVGRCFVRALAQREATGWEAPFSLVAINDVMAAEDMLYLTQYDTTHGPYAGPVAVREGRLHIGQQQPKTLQCTTPQELPWQAEGIDLVLECSGVFRGYNDAAQHLQVGAKRVLIGAVPFDRADYFAVYGVNHDGLLPAHRVVSAASCTTHAIAPLLQCLHQAYAVEQVVMTEVHAMTSDQGLLDKAHRDPRRGRAAGQNIVPTTSSAISAVQQVLPFLAGLISGGSIRVPTLNVAMVELTLRLAHTPSVAEINALFAQEAQRVPRILGYNEAPLVSADFNQRPESTWLDATQTLVQGDMVRVVAWYDNEWGYANRLLDLASWLAEQPNALL